MRMFGILYAPLHFCTFPLRLVSCTEPIHLHSQDHRHVIQAYKGMTDVEVCTAASIQPPSCKHTYIPHEGIVVNNQIQAWPAQLIYRTRSITMASRQSAPCPFSYWTPALRGSSLGSSLFVTAPSDTDHLISQTHLPHNFTI